ncbi:hypothetical protein N0V95_008256 [Ascochyta clinopodiicola]|nr:hypothetical protein N0V95_008256 [Ascochyta clinopodiicola]
MATTMPKETFAVALSSGKLRDTKCTLGANAPTERLDFGKWGNYTAVELLVFLPKTIRNFDVARRLTRNGLGIQTMTNIINAFRMWDKHPAPPQSILKKVHAAMRDHPDYKHWKTRDAVNEDSPDHDRTDLALQGFILQCIRFPANGWKVQTSIPFKSLAIDVQIFPDGDDALDLTRCVRYAADHPGETWIYPEDFERLTTMLGGPGRVRIEHCDAAVGHRWATWHLASHGESEWKPDDTDEESDRDLSDKDTDYVVDGDSEEEAADDEAENAAHILSLGRRVLRSARSVDGQHLVSLAESGPETHGLSPAPSTPELDSMVGGSEERWDSQLPENQSSAATVNLASRPGELTEHTAEVNDLVQGEDPRGITSTAPVSFPAAGSVWDGYSIDAMFAAEGLNEPYNS